MSERKSEPVEDWARGESLPDKRAAARAAAPAGASKAEAPAADAPVNAFAALAVEDDDEN